jgi:hypothetical protein
MVANAIIGILFFGGFDMKEKSIEVLMVEPGKHPVKTTLVNELSALQDAVSIGAEQRGLIELIGIEDGVSILCNEEGKLIGLEGNRPLGYDILCGVFYVVGEDEEGNLASLSSKQMEKYKKFFYEPKDFSPQEIADTVLLQFVMLDGDET